MQVIVVIDVKNGLVVHARGGDRTAYEPLRSPLTGSPEPLRVVESLLRLHPFETLYVADLDGIMQAAPDLETIAALSRAFPGLEIWLDNGVTDAEYFAAHHEGLARVRPVIGTESMTRSDDFAEISEAISAVTGRAPILSLDFKGGAVLGADLASSPAAWPDTVIAMTLNAVGSGAGPDAGLIAHLRSAACRPTRIVAAGGVRDRHDLASLAAAGADAALVATALHAGTLKAGDLVEIAGL